jgi:hypothetical protein
MIMENLFSNSLNEKNAYAFAKDQDNNRVHASWQKENSDVIIVVEYMPENYPSIHVHSWSTKEKYFKAIENVDWIMNNLSEDHPVSDELPLYLMGGYSNA